MQEWSTAVDLVNRFWELPPEALFDQTVVGAVLGKSAAWCERSRWAGTGPRYRKLGRHVRYQKADVLEWLDQQPSGNSTSALPAAA